MRETIKNVSIFVKFFSIFVKKFPTFVKKFPAFVKKFTTSFVHTRPLSQLVATRNKSLSH
jgi:hypothetical protein